LYKQILSESGSKVTKNIFLSASVNPSGGGDSKAILGLDDP
jgi:hypothetical protein